MIDRKRQDVHCRFMRFDLPYGPPGQVIGLLGGSFDPAHSGHVHITREALKRFGLDRVWWLVSPGNPLKSRGPAPMAERISRAQAVMDHPRVTVTGLEVQLGTRYTAQTLARLQEMYPGVRFVWLMGADNLAQFHLWQDWQSIMRRFPVGIIARPGDRVAARTSKAAQVFRASMLRGRAAPLLSHQKVPAWCMINVPMVANSSSAIRAKGEW